MLSGLFTAPDTWNGGFYELAIELGPRSDERLLAALETLWRSDDLDGCYADKTMEPLQQPRLAPTLETSLIGIATVPNGKQVACGTFTVSEDDEPDWIYFSLPMGALGNAYDVGTFPFVDGRSSHSWREPLDAWLVGMAVSIFTVVPFSLAWIGHEPYTHLAYEQKPNTAVPEERWIGHLCREGEHLAWHPPTHYGEDYTVGA